MARMLTIDGAAARRFLVRRHLLAPPRKLPATREGLLSLVERLGSLQFDPLEVPGARNHDLVLHARIAGYRRSLCDELLYGSDRSLFEAYNKSLNILPLSELPWHRIGWARTDLPRTSKLLADHADVAEAIVERIRREGPLPPSAFDRTTKIEGYWGATTSLSRHVLEALFLVGRVGIARREGNKRVYDLTERLFSKEILAHRVDDEEARVHRLLSRHRGVGLMAEGGASELTHGTGSAKDRVRRTRALVERGVLIPATVEGVRGVRHVLASEEPLLAEGALRKRSAAFLAPLDPLLWDRRLLRELFDFDYVWEVYTPLEKRKHGYYVLPILFGERLVGRIEPRFDRSEKKLHVAAIWRERGFDFDEPGFLPAMREALFAYRDFVGATSLGFGRGKLTATLKRACV
ncbi:MAG: DNA glycosylase AlkZ-like family protein [Polyangiales bacterium]